MIIDYYKLLQVPRNSTINDIKYQYRQLAKIYHPDKNNGSLESTEYFKKLSEAYTILSNPKKRYFYDIQLQFSFLESFELSDCELQILSKYYEKIMKSVEIRLFMKMCSSIPQSYKDNISKFFKKRYCNILQTTTQFKYIDISNLLSNYTIHLHRSLFDVYKNVLKQIIITENTEYYHLFITDSDYVITMNHHRIYNLYIRIQTVPHNNFYIRQRELHYIYPLSIYELYYGINTQIRMPDNSTFEYTDFNVDIHKQTRIQNKGLLTMGHSRDNLYIHYKLHKKNIDDKYKYFLQTIS